MDSRKMKRANTTASWASGLAAGALFVSLSSAGCDCGSSGADDGNVDDDAGTGEPSIASSRAKLRFKDGVRLRNDLSQILELSSEEICSELGQYDCVGEIHTISLLGVEPYGLGFYEPLKETAVTTPLALERVVISACSTRVDRDFDAPDAAAIFKDLGVTNGQLADTGATAVSEAIDLLYRRSLQRHATAEEIAHVAALYDDVVATGVADDPARSWAKAACFAVLTTVENLFY